ncbi:MAG: putative ABC transport system ATP-binding protein [Verrucomicrobiales bacterium]|jgi:putative ABC transport system ATP-binding protein
MHSSNAAISAFPHTYAKFATCWPRRSWHGAGKVIEIRDTVFRYPDGDFTLRIDSLDVASAEQVALIGSSGCGKTTLAHLIAGIHSAESGSIRVAGQTVHAMNDRQRRDFRISTIGFIFQEFELLDYLRASENILLPYHINRSLLFTDEARARAESLAETVGLADKLKKYPRQLSQGERQRLAICRALVTEPKIVIADEPTGNLDPTTSESVMHLIHDSVSTHKAALLMITHDHGLLEPFDRVIDMKQFH